jgi:predicted transcriptional regulator of viral defense system
MSRATSAQRLKAEALLRDGRLLRLRDLVRAGVAPETMARFVRNGIAVRPARGLYQLADAIPDARHTLAEAAALVPKGVVCLTSALQFHELTLQMPSAVWVAIDRAGWKPKVASPAIRFVRFSGRTLTEGVERHQIEGVDVPVYEPAKTIVDCFRYRNKIGLDIALEGLREGLRQRRVTSDQLWQFAKIGRIWSVIRPYVEAIVADDA